MSLDILLISATMFKERSMVHGNIDEKLLYPEIKFAQDSFILPILGSALFNKLQTIIGDGTITSDTANADYKTLLDKFIVDAMLYYTLSQLPRTLSYQFWNKGVVRKQGENTELPSMSELIDISEKFMNRAETYANRLRLYLVQNAPTKFSEYINPGTGVDDIRPENKSFTMPVYLGDDFDCGKTYEEKYQGNRPNCC